MPSSIGQEALDYLELDVGSVLPLLREQDDGTGCLNNVSVREEHARPKIL